MRSKLVGSILAGKHGDETMRHIEADRGYRDRDTYNNDRE